MILDESFISSCEDGGANSFSSENIIDKKDLSYRIIQQQPDAQ